MKVRVNTLKGIHFEINVQPNYTVMAVKKTIEESQGEGSYPWGNQVLVYKGKFLKDKTTLEENEVKEGNILLVICSKSGACGSVGAASAQPSTEVASQEPASTSSKTISDGKATEVPTDVNVRDAADKLKLQQGLLDFLQKKAMKLRQEKLPLQQGIRDFEFEVSKKLEEEVNLLMQLISLYDGKLEMVQHCKCKRRRELQQVRDCVLDCQSALEDDQTVLSSDGKLLELNSTFVSLNEELLRVLKEYEHALMIQEGEVDLPISPSPSNQAFDQGTKTATELNPAGVAPFFGLPDSSALNMLTLHSTAASASHSACSNEVTSQAVASTSKQIDLDRTTSEDWGQAEPGVPHSISMTLEEAAAIERLEAMGFDSALAIEAFLACNRTE
eukprot:TRINITY_DN7199_c0_g1_i1.p1 TRINITY_DN7199_c0_g1~~TRINITY_DN7199_c0_g1_i1.p1  ORF type:complete len:387 (+),score=89.73 TRINITY_DN7199_c0_g1_i1:145-1305(+)